MIVLYWVAIILIIYCYSGYPLAMAMLAKFFPRPVRRDAILPSVSIVISVWNEEDVIEAKIKNLLSLEYPPDKIEILIGSDASTDRTDEIIRQQRHERVRFIGYPHRRGKPAVLNDLVSQARHEIVIFNDARQILAPDALRELVQNFADPDVGCVSGELVFHRPKTSTGKGVDLYWRYEKSIRIHESRWHSMLGATGALYAIRRSLFSQIPHDMILDDMYVPFRIIEKGFRAVLDQRAKAFDAVAENPREEYRRKVRTICGNYQIFYFLPRMFIPFRSPIAWQLFSHKFLRVMVPFLLAFIFLSTWNFADEPFYALMGWTQIIFYVLACAGHVLRSYGSFKLHNLSRLCYIPYTFCLLNIAAIDGFWRFVTSRQEIAWENARS